MSKVIFSECFKMVISKGIVSCVMGPEVNSRPSNASTGRGTGFGIRGTLYSVNNPESIKQPLAPESINAYVLKLCLLKEIETGTTKCSSDEGRSSQDGGDRDSSSSCCPSAETAGLRSFPGSGRSRGSRSDWSK